MTDRQKYIRADVPADQELTARALSRIADWLDLADDQEITTVYPTLPGIYGPVDAPHSWLWAALLIADTCDVPTHALRHIANTIFRGVQGTLDNPVSLQIAGRDSDGSPGARNPGRRIT